MNTAESDDVGIGLLGPEGKPKRVAHIVGNILDFRDLVIVGEDDSVAFFLQVQNIFCLLYTSPSPRD